MYVYFEVKLVGPISLIILIRMPVLPLDLLGDDEIPLLHSTNLNARDHFTIKLRDKSMSLS